MTVTRMTATFFIICFPLSRADDYFAALNFMLAQLERFVKCRARTHMHGLASNSICDKMNDVDAHRFSEHPT